MRSSITVAAFALVALVGCHRVSSEEDERIDPETWDRMSSGAAPCLSASAPTRPDSAVTRWTLKSPTAVLTLPSDFREIPVQRGARRQWIGSDSSTFEYSVTTDPGGLAGGGEGVVQEPLCFLPVAQHRAFTARLRLNDAASRTTSYLAISTVVLQPGVTVNVFIEARSDAMRTRLLQALSELDVRGAR